MKECPFCQIANKELESFIVFEDDNIMAFLDNRPIREGHCQIIPNQHIETFEQLPSELAHKIITMGQRLAQKMKHLYEVDRVAFLFTGGDVPHTHAHVLPMHKKTDITSARFIVNAENIQFRSSHLSANRDDLLKVQAKLKLE